MVLLHVLVVDNEARIVINLVDNSIGIDERHPPVVIDWARPVSIGGRVQFIDCDDLARLRVLDKVMVLITPPSSDVGAESLSLVLRVCTRAGVHIENADFQDISRFCPVDQNGPRQDVDASTATSPIWRIHRPGPTPVYLLLILGPVVDALGTGIPLDHPVIVVRSLMGQALHSDVVSRTDFDDGLQSLAKISPMDRFI